MEGWDNGVVVGPRARRRERRAARRRQGTLYLSLDRVGRYATGGEWGRHVNVQRGEEFTGVTRRACARYKCEDAKGGAFDHSQHIFHARGRRELQMTGGMDVNLLRTPTRVTVIQKKPGGRPTPAIRLAPCPADINARRSQSTSR